MLSNLSSSEWLWRSKGLEVLSILSCSAVKERVFVSLMGFTAQPWTGIFIQFFPEAVCMTVRDLLTTALQNSPGNDGFCGWRWRVANLKSHTTSSFRTRDNKTVPQIVFLGPQKPDKAWDYLVCKAGIWGSDSSPLHFSFSWVCGVKLASAVFECFVDRHCLLLFSSAWQTSQHMGSLY